ncbi:MAG: AAA domain-containing protein [Prevotella sp.]|nr:AAA domain-containing protein [Prevotella sp.]
MRQHLLLKMEYNYEKKAYQQATESIGIRRLVKRGDAWMNVRIGKTFYNSLNQMCIEIYRTEDQEIEHNFEYGRQIAFFQAPSLPPRGEEAPLQLPRGGESLVTFKGSKEDSKKGDVRFLSIIGSVSYVDGDRMVVSLQKDSDAATLSSIVTTNSSPRGGWEGAIGICLSFDETSYRLMFDALERVMHARGNRLAYLRDLFYSKQPAQHFHFQPMQFPWLNKTQEKAVNEVLWTKDVMVVHGPPGTGKTTTLVEAINETLRRESQVLVCAQSNMAVDWISEQLVDRGINVLRVGNPTRVNDKMLSFTYERRFEAHPDYPQLWSLRKAIREMRSKRKRGNESYHQQLDRLNSRAAELEIRINAEIFGEARVIACTLTGAASRVLEGMKFSTLFIDEAAQALEAACWIPIRKVSRVIFAGDHCQLPPTVKSIAALKAGLGKTLMERIVENKPEIVTLLQVQYRMNDEIMRFSSNEFYGGKLQTAPEIKYRGILDYDIPISWYDTDELSEETENREQFVGESFGRINKAEAELTLQHLELYYSRIGKQRILDERIDVGIISPYRAQVQLLRRLIRKREFFKPFRHLITVNTVDGFQGQERDVIVLSLVRSNDEGQIGFLRDLRRMNVAITRARMKLIILGSVDTLTKHPFYKRLHEYIESLEI